MLVRIYTSLSAHIFLLKSFIDYLIGIMQGLHSTVQCWKQYSLLAVTWGLVCVCRVWQHWLSSSALITCRLNYSTAYVKQYGFSAEKCLTCSINAVTMSHPLHDDSLTYCFISLVCITSFWTVMPGRSKLCDKVTHWNWEGRFVRFLTVV